MKRSGHRPVYLCFALLHLLGMSLYLDLQEVWRNPPVAGTDYATHWAAVWSASHSLEEGHLWGYDPFFMAGHPEGTLFSVDNKLIEVASWTLSRMGVALPLAYNLVLVCLFFLAPLALYPAARWFKLSRKEALLTQAAGLGLWYLDPALRWAWQGGTLAFAASVCLSLLVLASAARLTDPEEPAATLAWPAWFVLGPLLFWLHAMTFVLLCLPLVVLTAGRWPRVRGWRRMVLLLWPPLVLVVNAPWLLNTMLFAWARRASDQFLQGGLPALAADLLGAGHIDGASTVSLLGLRWLVLLLGGWGLWRLARRDPGARAVAAGVGAGLLLAYGAVYVPGGGNLQPYRHIEQAMLWAAVGLGPGLRAAVGVAPRRIRRVGFVPVVLAALWVTYAAWLFRPPFLGGPAYHRWQGPSAEVKAICDHLQRLPLEQGRVLTDDFRVGALLPWCSWAQVIGGPFIEIWTQYGYTNTTIEEFLEVPYQEYTAAGWQQAVAAYNVRWLIVHQEWGVSEWYTLADWLEDHPEQVVRGPRFGVYQFYEVETAAELPFTVTPSPGRLLITNAPDRPFTLPFHWIPYLKAEPASVWLSQEQVGADPIPFIRVDPAGLSSFVVCTDYFFSDKSCE